MNIVIYIQSISVLLALIVLLLSERTKHTLTPGFWADRWVICKHIKYSIYATVQQKVGIIYISRLPQYHWMALHRAP